MKSKIFVFFWSLVLFPTVVLAGGSTGFVPLVGIPGLDKEPDFNSYVNALYALAISVAALIAVIQIVIGGAQYMMDDLITHKSAAKERIKNALIGLLIIIAAALILTTINSDLTHLNINAPRIEMDNSKPDPAFVSRNFEMTCANAMTINSTCTYENCSDLVNSNKKITGTDKTCGQLCAPLNGAYETVWENQCFVIQSVADQCDPQQSFSCCRFKGRLDDGLIHTIWDNSLPVGQQCTKLDEVRIKKIEECYQRENTWDEAGDTCLTKKCDLNTDQRCCTITHQSQWIDGACLLNVVGEAISEQDCYEDGMLFNRVSQSCVEFDPTKDYWELDPGPAATCAGVSTYQQCMTGVCELDHMESSVYDATINRCVADL